MTTTRFHYAVASLLVAALSLAVVANLFAENKETDKDDDGIAKVIAKQAGVTLEMQVGRTMQSGCAHYVTLTVTNGSERDVAFFPVVPQCDGIGLDIHQDGKTVAMTRRGDARLSSVSGYVKWLPARTIKKGEKLAIVLNLSRYYDLSIPGEYDLSARWVGGYADTITQRYIDGKAGQWIALRTDAVKLTVLDDSKEQLLDSQKHKALNNDDRAP